MVLMYPFYDLVHKVKVYFRYTKEEMKSFLVVILVFSFIISFNEWGYGREFEFFTGLKNFFLSFLIVTLSVFVHDAAQRIMALDSGFRLQFQLWWYGILLGLVLAFASASLTGGKHVLWFLAPGGVWIHHMAVHRIGFFRYGTNIKAIGYIGLTGPVASILLGVFFKTLIVWFPNLPLNAAFIDKIFIFNMVYAFWTLLPIPPLDGNRVFFLSRLVYVLIWGSIAGYVALIFFFGVYSFIFAGIIGIIVWFIFLVTFEMKHGG